MKARAKVGMAKLGLLLCMAVGMLVVPSIASAEFSFCPSGTGAGQCDIPGAGVAVNHEMGRVYVTDWNNQRVNAFNASNGDFLFAFGWGVDTGGAKFESCTTASGCQVGVSGSGGGQFFAPLHVAVDNSGGPSQGDVYVTDQSYRVQKFDPDGKLLLTIGGAQGTGKCQFNFRRDPIAVNPEGVLYVLDTPLPGQGESGLTRLQRFEPTGGCIGETTVPLPGLASQFDVDSNGDFYVTLNAGKSMVNKYDSSWNLLHTLDSVAPEGIGVDEANGDLYVGEQAAVTVYDSAGNILRRFGYGKLTARPYGIAVHHSGEGDFFAVGLGRGVAYLKTPPPGPIVSPPSLKADPVSNVRATVKAQVNPEGKETEVHVEYVDDAHFDEGGLGFASPATKSTETTTIPAGFDLEGLEHLIGCPVATKALIEEGKCLNPETEYHWRVVATNADNPTGVGEGTAEGVFTTKKPLEIEGLFATEASTDTATLNAIVNPLGIPGAGYFEYVDDATYQESGFAAATKLPDVGAGQAQIDFGAGEAGIRRSVTAYPLSPSTTYHYRFLAANPLIDAPQLSEEKTFRTFAPGTVEACPENEAFRTSASAPLPDCRAYELVSPLDKANGDIVVLEEAFTFAPATLNQSSVSGSKLAYGSFRSFGDAPSAPFTSQYIAARGPEGWESHAVSPPNGTPVSPTLNAVFDNEIRAFSPDLCDAWVIPLGDVSLAEGAIPGVWNLYRRTDQLCGGESYEALTTIQPENTSGAGFRLEFQGLSADGEVAVYATRDNLSADSPPQPPGCAGEKVGNCNSRLYARAGGELRYLCIFPSGEGSEGGCSAGTGEGPLTGGKNRLSRTQNAVSADGTRVFWSPPGKDPVYVRENPFEPESAHQFGAAVGSGDLVGPVAATGTLAKTLTTVSKVKVKNSGEKFTVGQEITATKGGIPAGTTIAKIEEPEAGVFKLTLSKAVTLTEASAELIGVASEVVTNAKADSGAFAVGQELVASGGGIAEETTIVKVEGSKLTLSAKATKTEAGAALRGSSACTEADKACTVAVSATAEKQSGTSESDFRTAAKDGSVAIFTTGKAGQNLYEFEVDAGVTKKIAGGVRGFVGASEDASRVYFVSSEAIPGSGPNSEGDEPEAGKDNLYLHEAGAGSGSYRFIATLAGRDSGVASSFFPIDRRNQVSPNGLHAAFMSTVPLTGYDNADASSGEADFEVFLYDGQANGGAGQLRCVSCNPSGARPVGSRARVASVETLSAFPWVAARLPAFESDLYVPRALAEDGSRLFFESQDSLAPRDTNGRIDVYQWEAPGAGSCDEGDGSYSDAAGGCVELISSGQSPRDSEFVDASPSGSDVFFATLSSLLPQDYGLVDIYDARVGGGFAPEAPPPAECEGEACQSSPEAPNDPTPASSTFEGAGNVSEGGAAATPKPCAKGKVRRKGRCVAKKHKRAHKRQAKANGRAAR